MKKTIAALLMLACAMLMLSACAAQRPSAAAQTHLAQLERQAAWDRSFKSDSLGSEWTLFRMRAGCSQERKERSVEAGARPSAPARDRIYMHSLLVRSARHVSDAWRLATPVL